MKRRPSCHRCSNQAPEEPMPRCTESPAGPCSPPGARAVRLFVPSRSLRSPAGAWPQAEGNSHGATDSTETGVSQASPGTPPVEARVATQVHTASRVFPQALPCPPSAAPQVDVARDSLILQSPLLHSHFPTSTICINNNCSMESFILVIPLEALFS